MQKKTFVPKLKFLELIEKMEVVGPQAIADRFGVTYAAAAERLWRYSKIGLVEPLGSERGRWVLTTKGYNHLEYLRKMQEAEVR